VTVWLSLTTGAASIEFLCFGFLASDSFFAHLPEMEQRLWDAFFECGFSARQIGFSLFGFSLHSFFLSFVEKPRRWTQKDDFFFSAVSLGRDVRSS
jgi:hypothetical protein